MTRKFNVYISCPHCGERITAETAFGRWMRNHPMLDSGNGIIRTDTDHTILRYKTHNQGRDFQLIMDVEVKERGARPDKSQADILNFKHQLALKTSHNMHGARTFYTHYLKSSANGRRVKVKYLGYHLLQFENTDPTDGWIKWDGKLITVGILVGILTFELNPCYPDRPMIEFLRDRHRQCQLPLIIEI